MKAPVYEVAWLCLPCLSCPRRRLWAAPPRCSARPSPPAHAEQSTCFLIRWRCRRPLSKTRNFNNMYLAVGSVSCYFLGFNLFVSSTLISKKNTKKWNIIFLIVNRQAKLLFFKEWGRWGRE
jgi:hypothetical protein